MCTFTCAEARVFLLQALNTETLFCDRPIITTGEIAFLIAFKENQQSHYCVITTLLFAYQSVSLAQFPDSSARVWVAAERLTDSW